MTEDVPSQPDGPETPSPSEADLGKRPGFGRRVGRIAVRVAVGYLIIVVILSLLQRKLIYHPIRSGRLPADAAAYPRGMLHDVAVETDDGLTLHGWHVLRQGRPLKTSDELDAHLKSAKFVVFYFHGNAGNRSHRLFNFETFIDNGADVFSFDYRGYAENPGKPSEDRLSADARAIWNYAVEERGVPSDRIVLFGESLGSGVAVPLAARLCREERPPAAVILWGAFSSLTDVGRSHYPWLPIRWVLQDTYESVDRAGDVGCPILQIHGEIDRIIPADLGRKLFAAFPEQSSRGIPKRWIEVPATGHNDFPVGVARRAVRELFDQIADRPERGL